MGYSRYPNVRFSVIPDLSVTKIILNFLFSFFLFHRLEELLDTFNDEGISNYLVAFMRLLTSKQMKKEADLYINYIDDQADVNEFCALEVEPMFKESDFVHIHALSKVCIDF